MEGTYRKHHEEQETIKINWSPKINSMVNPGYTISAVDVKIVDDKGKNCSADMIEGTPQTVWNDIYVTIKKGEYGKSYLLKIKVTLSKEGSTDQIQRDNLVIEVTE